MNILLSYHNVNDVDLIVNLWKMGCSVLIDSGAYSAHTLGVTIDVDEYIRYCKEVKRYVTGCFTLDVIGDPRASMEQHRYIKSRGVAAIPVWQSFDLDAAALDAFLDDEPYVALGGLVTMGANKAQVSLSQDQVFRHIAAFIRAVNNRSKIHLLGYSKLKYIRKISSRIESCDTSTVSQDIQYGEPIRCLMPGTREEFIFPAGRFALSSVRNWRNNVIALHGEDVPHELLIDEKKGQVSNAGRGAACVGGWLYVQSKMQCKYYSALVSKDDPMFSAECALRHNLIQRRDQDE